MCPCTTPIRALNTNLSEVSTFYHLNFCTNKPIKAYILVHFTFLTAYIFHARNVLEMKNNKVYISIQRCKRIDKNRKKNHNKGLVNLSAESLRIPIGGCLKFSNVVPNWIEKRWRALSILKLKIRELCNQKCQSTRSNIWILINGTKKF